MFPCKIILIFITVTTSVLGIWQCDTNPSCYPRSKTCDCFREYTRCCRNIDFKSCRGLIVFHTVAGISYQSHNMILFKPIKTEDGTVPGVERTILDYSGDPRNRSANFTAQVGLTRRPQKWENLELKTYDDFNRHNETVAMLDGIQHSICFDLDREEHFPNLKKEIFDFDFTPRNITVSFTSTDEDGKWVGEGYGLNELVFQVSSYRISGNCSYRIDFDMFYRYKTNYDIVGMEKGVEIYTFLANVGLTDGDIDKGESVDGLYLG